MKIGRSILAFLIAVSVAVLPAAGSIGTVMKPIEPVDMATTMEDMDCCPHMATLCDKAINGCSMATCALKCFSFAGALSSPIVFPSHVAQLNPVHGTNPFNSQTDSPPFRPPRV